MRSFVAPSQFSLLNNANQELVPMQVGAILEVQFGLG
jgi:hypothetical protein